MSDHQPFIEPVPVPGWTLHRPTCSCGWSGDIVRIRPFATDQVTEHLASETPTNIFVQSALFDL